VGPKHLLVAVAIAAACQALRVLLEAPENPEDQENRVHLEPLGPQESHQPNHASQSLHRHASPALLALQDPLELLAHRETLDNLDNREAQAKTLLQANQVPRVHQVRPDHQDSQEPQESQDNLHNPSQSHPDRPDLQVMPELPDHQVTLDRQEEKANRVHQGQRDPLDLPDHPETTDNLDPLVNQDQREAPEKRVFVQSTVPLMEEFSSRMELVVKWVFNETNDGDMHLLAIIVCFYIHQKKI